MPASPTNLQLSSFYILEGKANSYYSQMQHPSPDQSPNICSYSQIYDDNNDDELKGQICVDNKQTAHSFLPELRPRFLAQLPCCSSPSPPSSFIRASRMAVELSVLASLRRVTSSRSGPMPASCRSALILWPPARVSEETRIASNCGSWAGGPNGSVISTTRVWMPGHTLAKYFSTP
eukprot:CAMPEP_0194571110 /NCGR_PEP_ID=MMETSP0292-20121207/8187_1 /TAXON_ID=39354 /ORGANISM="Heterosigma akashiwo, Strain CCMP2393" /LENGTH=176 /DNA_ID=CAMNT_0039421755 /DNA_START=531 /DNA_END=1061 /DNA_ORIENTATION=+